MARAFSDAGWRGFAVDHRFNRHDCVAPCFMADLSSSEGQNACTFMLMSEGVKCVGMEPPCGTASRSRDIPIEASPGQAGPRPLRNAEHPLGFPHLKGLDAAKVASANSMYQYCADVAAWFHVRGFWYIENPANSWLWWIPFYSGAKQLGGSS